MLNWVLHWSVTEDSCRNFHKSSKMQVILTKTTWGRSIKARQMVREVSALHARVAHCGVLTVKAQSDLSIPTSLTRSQLCSTLTELSAFYKPSTRFKAARKLLISWKRPSRNSKAWYPSRIAQFWWQLRTLSRPVWAIDPTSTMWQWLPWWLRVSSVRLFLSLNQFRRPASPRLTRLGTDWRTRPTSPTPLSSRTRKFYS